MSRSSSAIRWRWALKCRMSPPTVKAGPSAEISRARADPPPSTSSRAASSSAHHRGSMALRDSAHTIRSRATSPATDTVKRSSETKGLADHVEEDLVGAGADAVEPQVAQHPFDAVLG